MDFFGAPATATSDFDDFFFGAPGVVAATSDTEMVASAMSSSTLSSDADENAMSVDTTNAQPAMASILSSACSEKERQRDAERDQMLTDFNTLLAAPAANTVVALSSSGLKVATKLLFQGTALISHANRDGPHEISRRLERAQFASVVFPALPTSDASHGTVLLLETVGMFELVVSSRDAKLQSRVAVLAATLLLTYARRAIDFINTHFQVEKASPKLLTDIEDFALRLYTALDALFVETDTPVNLATKRVDEILLAITQSGLEPAVLDSQFLSRAQLRSANLRGSLSASEITPPGMKRVPTFDADMAIFQKREQGAEISSMSNDLDNYFLLLGQINTNAARRLANSEFQKQMLARDFRVKNKPSIEVAISAHLGLLGREPKNAARDRALLRIFLLVWLPAQYGFGYEPSSNEFRVERFLSQLMCCKGEGRFTGLLPLLSLPIRAVSGSDAGDSLGSFSLFRAVCTFAETVERIKGSSIDTSSVTLAGMSATTIKMWASAVVNSASPRRSDRYVSLAAADGAAMHNNLMVALAFYAIFTRVPHTFPPIVSFASTRPILSALTKPARIGAVAAERLFETSSALLGDHHPDGVAFSPLHGALGPGAANFLHSYMLARETVPSLVIFLGYADARAPLVLAAMDSTVTCVCVAVSAEFHDRHTQVAHTAAERIRAMMAMQVEGLERRVKFITSGTVESFHASFNALYLQALSVWSRRNPSVPAPGRVVLVANHYHAVMEFNVASALYSTWVERMLSGAILSPWFSDSNNASRLMLLSTTRPKLDRPSDLSTFKRLAVLPVSVGRDFGQGILPLEATSDYVWMVGANFAATLQAPVITSRDRALEFAETVLFQASDDIARAWLEQPDPLAREATRVNALVAAAGTQVVSLAEIVRRQIDDWTLALISVSTEEARKSINDAMKRRTVEVVAELASAVILTTNHAQPESRKAVETVVAHLFAQWANSSINADSNDVMAALRLALEKSAQIEPSKMEIEIPVRAPQLRTTTVPLVSSSSLFATVAPNPSYSVLSSSVATAAVPSSQQSAAVVATVKSSAARRTTPEGRARTSQLVVSTITGTSGLRPEQLKALENPVIDVNVISSAITEIRSIKVRNNDGLQELSSWAASLGRLFVMASNSAETAYASATSAPGEAPYRTDPKDTNIHGPTPPITSSENAELEFEAVKFQALTEGVHACLLKLIGPAFEDNILREGGFDVLAPGMVYMQMIANVVHAMTRRVARKLDKRTFSGGVLMSDTQLFEYLGSRLGIDTATLSRLQQLVFFHPHWIAPFTAGVDMYTGNSVIDVKPELALFVAKKTKILSEDNARLMQSNASREIGNVMADVRKKAGKDDKKKLQGESDAMYAELERRIGADFNKMFMVAIAMTAMEHAISAPLLPFASPPLGFMCDHVRISDVPGEEATATQAADLVATFRKIADFGSKRIDFIGLGAQGTAAYSAMINVALSSAVRGYFFDGPVGAIREMDAYFERLKQNPKEGFSGDDDWRIASDSDLQTALENVTTRYFLYRSILIEDTMPLESIGVHPKVIEYIKEMYARNSNWRTVELIDANEHSMGAHFVPSANPGDILALDTSSRTADDDEDADDTDDRSKNLRLLDANRDYSNAETNGVLRTNCVVFGGIKEDPSIVFTTTSGNISPTTKNKIIKVADSLYLRSIVIQVQSTLAAITATTFRWNMYTGYVPPAFAAGLAQIASKRNFDATVASSAMVGGNTDHALALAFHLYTPTYDWIDERNVITNMMKLEGMASAKDIKRDDRDDDDEDDGPDDGAQAGYVPVKTAHKWAVLKWMYGDASREHVKAAHELINNEQKRVVDDIRDSAFAMSYSLSAQLTIHMLIDKMPERERAAFFLHAPYIAYALELAQKRPADSAVDDEMQDGGDADMSEALGADDNQDEPWIDVATDLGNSPSVTFSSSNRSAVVRVFVAWFLFVRYNDAVWKKYGEVDDIKVLTTWADELRQTLARRRDELIEAYEDRINRRIETAADTIKKSDNESTSTIAEKFNTGVLRAVVARAKVTAKDLEIEWALDSSNRGLAGNIEAIEAEVKRRVDSANHASTWLETSQKTQWVAVQLWRKALRNAAAVIHPDVIGRFYPRYVTVRHAGWNMAIWSAITTGQPPAQSSTHVFFMRELDEALRRVMLPLYEQEYNKKLLRPGKSSAARDTERMKPDQMLRAALGDFLHVGYKNFNNLVNAITENNTVAARAILETLPSMSYATRKMSTTLAVAMTSSADFALSIRGAATSKAGIPFYPSTEIMLVRLRAALDEGGLEEKQKKIKDIVTEGQIFITDELIAIAGPATTATFANLESQAANVFVEAFKRAPGSSNAEGIGRLFIDVITYLSYTKGLSEGVVTDFYKNIVASKEDEFRALMDRLVTFMYTAANMGAYTIMLPQEKKKAAPSSTARKPASSSSSAQKPAKPTK